ncbi:MipA/OmpV family protein [Erwinia sp. 9145]|uniref:MipA/OmpV family protein n=1 Tax=Erwinia sp. 9145 TaxID=1500895 RepID=UPI0005557D99|nr:MipA/OmpV family protein [Erwinia sp. 9145]
MNYFKLSALTVLFSTGFAASVVQAEPVSLGASVVYSESPYKGGDSRYLPLPLINYDGDSFYIHGFQAGYYLWKDQEDQLSLTILGSPQQFDTDDTDNKQLKQLDNRHMTALAGATWRHNAEWGTVRTTVAADVLDNSNGYIWDLAYLYRFQFGQLSVTPGIGAVYSSENQNDYYYGVSKRESRRSGLASYDADDSWNPYLELTTIYAINESWNATLAGRYTRLSDEVKDSPMVDQSSQLTVWTGISYTF